MFNQRDNAGNNDGEILLLDFITDNTKQFMA